MLQKLLKLLKAFNGNVAPGEIAHAFAWGAVLGFMPKDNLLWYILFVFVLFVRINKPSYLVMILIASGISPALDGLFDTIGYAFLTVPAFSNFFAALLEVPFAAFTKFNNTVVAGSFLTGIVLYIPLYFTGRLLVFLWRKYAASLIKNSKISKVINKLPLIEKIIEKAGEI